MNGLSQIFFLLILSFCFFFNTASAMVKGIYITQETMENTNYLKHLIKESCASGINAFIIDMEIPSKRYHMNLDLLKASNIAYIARVIIFPNGGGTREQVASVDYWNKKYALIKTAVEWGAKEIQLDYIRYNTKQRPSHENALNIYKVIQWYKNKLSAQNIPLQIDVFGVASFGESKYIGQNIKLFAQSIDAVCPMVYPSHYFPFRIHATQPYATVYNSLISIKEQFDNKLPFKLYPYIELTNFHFPFSRTYTLKYIREQIRAAENAGADGFFVWSPHNKYDNLFRVLKSKQDNEPVVSSRGGG